MKKRIYTAVLLCLLLALCPTAALAYDYQFEPESSNDFYDSSNYEAIYGGEYQYGGVNRSDFMIPTVAYGYHDSSTGQGGQSSGSGMTGSTGSTSVPPTYDTTLTYPDLWTGTQMPTAAYTPATSLTRSDGSIGTLAIPAVKINMKVYDGATLDNMKKGAAHFADTSAWFGNIGICGHNRGATYVIGSIKDLKIGDTVKYTTTLGTRTYSVSFVGKIAESNWSYLNATSDNRITLITCAADQRDLRWCVQATEVK